MVDDRYREQEQGPGTVHGPVPAYYMYPSTPPSLGTPCTAVPNVAAVLYRYTGDMTHLTVLSMLRCTGGTGMSKGAGVSKGAGQGDCIREVNEINESVRSMRSMSP